MTAAPFTEAAPLRSGPEDAPLSPLEAGGEPGPTGVAPAGVASSPGREAYTPYHSQFLAHRLTLAGRSEDALAKTLATARVDMNPHQVDAALFALQSPVAKGVLLGDEVGLGKTIEAALVMAQRWAERKRRILLVVPASLRKQWQQELWDKFSLPAVIMEARTYTERRKAGARRPFEAEDAVVICSYEFAARKADDVAAIGWDLAVLDEAHRLRNVHSASDTARARRLQDALRRAFKVLLTATPLQNNIMELYGLVSFMDEHVFGDPASFRVRYAGAQADAATMLRLRERLKPICRRTLRRTVMEAGHISYTRRTAVTFHFDPHPEEEELYERVSAFLQRPDTCYLGGKPNALVTMALRKILGSSSYAIGQTLSRIIERLEAERAAASLETLSDLDTIDEMAEEAGGMEDAADEDAAPARPTPAMIAAEVEELRRYRDLAASITSNAKGERLAQELPGLLDAVVAKGGARKAVIFTESVRTQGYLADLLARAGFAGQIVLLNGSNNDAESQRIYAEWKARHAGTDRVSGSKSADMKAAVVDAFRDSRTILIATESGAEGINLQFCSLLVNYDLPWNPQRVEQRIGRCHRYGQKIDVAVVNLLNARNHAEQRVFQLLSSKFRLFEGVFGASDEVLGAIESGVDFERRVHEIVQTSRTAEEIEAAFDDLTESLRPQIAIDMQAAREKLLHSVDMDVVRLLKTRGETIKRVLDDYEQRLVVLARAELPGVPFREHRDGSPVFEHDGLTWTTGWPLADEQGWQFFRVADGNLALDLVAQAKARTLAPAEIRFDYGAYRQGGGGRLTDIEGLIGHSGWLRVSKLSLRAAGQDVEHVIAAAQMDGGEAVDPKAVERLFLLPGAQVELGAAPSGALDRVEKALHDRLLEAGAQENARWLDVETEKLDAYAEDLAVAAEEEIKRLEREVKDRNRKLRATAGLTVQQKVDEKRAIKRMEGEIDDRKLALHQRRKEVREEVRGLLDGLEQDLMLEPKVALVFTIRWNVTA